ncbi:hypothetical protein [Longispora albida]|uniref:hypothetical protein n=1 Tax=Longispora albida TaxID=203523 RepID=UPI0003642909|nr:hypothetical protein [Longispora albida]
MTEQNVPSSYPPAQPAAPYPAPPAPEHPAQQAQPAQPAPQAYPAQPAPPPAYPAAPAQQLPPAGYAAPQPGYPATQAQQLQQAPQPGYGMNYPAPPLGPLHGPWGPPPPPKPSRAPLVLSILALVLAVLCAGGGVALTGVKISEDNKALPDSALYLAGVDPKARDAAVTELLNRRSKAVLDKNKDAFLADVDASQPELVKKQTSQFENLTKLPFDSFTYTLEKARYDLVKQKDLTARYRRIVVVPGVSTKFRIKGMNEELETATPYAPIFGRTAAGKWVLAGEAVNDDVDATIPFGIGTQPWQGDPIAVRTSENAVLVYSPGDEAKSGEWIGMLEDSIREVKKVRPDKWNGKVYAIAVRDAKLFNEYKGVDPAKAVAFATTRWDRVSGWSSAPKDTKRAGSLFMMNPRQLDRDSDDTKRTFVHEIAHIAMDPFDHEGEAPRWLIEGFAEWVEYGAKVDVRYKKSFVDKYLRGKDLSKLPDSATFYRDEGENYALGAAAVELIAETYGKQKLLAFYEWFGTNKTEDDKPETQEKAFKEVLGTTMADFTVKWRKAILDEAIP